MAPQSNTAVEQLLAESASSVRRLMRGVLRYFVEEAGCDAYVKTIYVGFELDRVMVAAAYPHAAALEIALALPDVVGEGLVDAAHLTWRTMPVAVEMSTMAELERARPHFELAVQRVRTGLHDVELPQERFMGRERRIADQKLLGRRT